MDVFLEMLLLVVSVALFFLLLSLSRGKVSLKRVSTLLSFEVFTEREEPLVKITPLALSEAPAIKYKLLQLSDIRKAELNETLAQMLGATIFSHADIEAGAAAFHIILFAGILERIGEGSSLPLNSKEILVTKTVNRYTRRVSENVKFMENILPPVLGLVLWKSFVTDRTKDFVKEIYTGIVNWGETVENLGEWLDAEDIGRLKANSESLLQISGILRVEDFDGMDSMGSRLENIERDQLKMLNGINQKIAAVNEFAGALKSYDEKELFELITKYEKALRVYLYVLYIRLVSAMLGSLTPSMHAIGKRCLSDCQNMLEEESGQLTTMFMTVDAANTKDFLELSLDNPEKTTLFLSLLYPSFMLQELVKWYRRHRMAEGIPSVRTRLQLKFLGINDQINDMIRMAINAGLYTKDPLKGGLSLLAITNSEGVMEEVYKILDMRGAAAK